MGFVVILYQTQMKNVSVPKISVFVPIDGEVLASLCSDNCKQILQKPILEDLYGVLSNYLCALLGIGNRSESKTSPNSYL